MQGDKIRPLWGTAQLFMHPRYTHGAATRYRYLGVLHNPPIYFVHNLISLPHDDIDTPLFAL